MKFLGAGWRVALSVAMAMGGCARHAPPAGQPVAVVDSGSESAARGRGTQVIRAQLRAVIRDQSFLDTLPEGERAKLISEPFLARMVIIYMVDDHGAARLAEAQDLQKSNVNRDALRAVVEWNLATALPGALSCERDAMTAIGARNYYESSRLLLTQQWSDLAAKKGSIVVAVPSNDALLVACNPSPATLQKMAVTIQNSYPQAARPVSASLLSWSGEGWQELKQP